MKDSLFVFQNGTIDSNSVTEHASGTNVDFFAVPTSSLTSISALEGKIVLYFKSSNVFENSKANQAKVTLNTTEGSESRAAIATWALTLEEGKIYIHDDTRSTYPSNYGTTISGVDSIIRPITERFDDGGISNVVEDLTPQLGGSLDVNGKKITSVSNGDIDIEPNGTGDVLLGNFKFDADQSVGAGQDNHVLTYDNSTQKISLEASAGGGTTPQSFPLSFETVLTSGDYFFGNLRYGWNYVVWNRSDNNMQLGYFELVSAMVAVNDYTTITVKGIAGSMLTSNSITIEFSLWKGTNAGGTGTFSSTQQGSTTVDYDTSDVMKPLSFSATGLTINEGDYIFFAVRNTSYSVREDIACSTTITFS